MTPYSQPLEIRPGRYHIDRTSKLHGSLRSYQKRGYSGSKIGIRVPTISRVCKSSNCELESSEVTILLEKPERWNES
jgi:hypothetical protein